MAEPRVTVWIKLPDRPDPIRIDADGGCAVVRADYGGGKIAWGCGPLGAGPLDPDGDIPGRYFRLADVGRRLDAVAARAEEIEFAESSGNVFADLGLPDADRRLRDAMEEIRGMEGPGGREIPAEGAPRRNCIPIWTMKLIATSEAPMDATALAAASIAALRERGLHVGPIRAPERADPDYPTRTLEGTIEVGAARNGTLVELAAGSPYRWGDVSVRLLMIISEAESDGE